MAPLSLHMKVCVIDSLPFISITNVSITGGIFRLDLFLPDDYPMTPPKIRFLTKIYHPNIDQEGNVCLNILREDWKPVLNLNAVIVGMQVCLFSSGCAVG